MTTLHEAARMALEALLKRDERNTCHHEETHRGGTIWTTCSQCGAKWADDEGGKPEWQEPPEWEAARQAIAAMAASEAQAEPVARIGNVLNGGVAATIVPLGRPRLTLREGDDLYTHPPAPQQPAPAERGEQPPCAGRNCGSTDGRTHSAECIEDHLWAIGAERGEQTAQGVAERSAFVEEAMKMAENIADAEHASATVQRLHRQFLREFLEGAALASAPRVPQWQPMETAPKDGTAVLCFRLLRGLPDIATASWKDYAEAFGGPGWTYAEGRHAPTHWMPLPAAPQPEAGA